MADLENRVDKLEEKVRQLEIDITKSLGEIKTDLAEIKTALKSGTADDDLKNELIKKDIEILQKDVKLNSERTEKLENNHSKIVWTFVTAFIGILIEAVVFYIRTK